MITAQDIVDGLRELDVEIREVVVAPDMLTRQIKVRVIVGRELTDSYRADFLRRAKQAIDRFDLTQFNVVVELTAAPPTPRRSR